MTAEIAALPVGFAIATLATMVGLGGGLLWTPYLILVARLDPVEAVLTSLIVQVAGMGSGGISVMKSKKTDLRLAAVLGACAVPGVVAGVVAGKLIPKESIVFLLGAVALATALVFVYAREDLDAGLVKEVTLKAAGPYFWLATLFSVLTGMLSVGIGDFMVPVLRNRLGMKMDAAIGACLMVMATNAGLAAILHLIMGERFSLGIVLWAIPGVILGGQVGPRIAGKVPDQTLKEIFIYGLSLIGIHVMFRACG